MFTKLSTKFDGFNAITIFEHNGVSIVQQYDVRGPQHDAFYELITVELDGEECTFNSLDDACDFIDEVLDCVSPEEHDPAREWGLRLRDVA